MTGKQLKDTVLAEKKNLSAIARELGLTPQALESKFRITDPKISFLLDLSKASGIPLHAFFKGKMQTLNEPETPYGMDYKTRYLECLEEQNKLLRENAELKTKSPDISLALNQPQLKSKPHTEK